MRFSEDGVLDDPLFLVGTVKRLPQVKALLRQEKELASPYGRRRSRGSFVLLYVAFCIDRDADVHSFYSRHRSTRLWSLCGFKERPCRSTVYQRFAEIDRLDGDLQDTVAEFVTVARGHVPEIGRHVHIDGSLASSHATLLHACDHPQINPALGCGNLDDHPLSGVLPLEEATRHHHREDEAAADESATYSGARLAPLDDDGLRRWGLDPDDRTIRRSRWYERDGHLLRCRDPEAGVRTYAPRGGRGRTTIGMNHLVVTDHATGATLAFDVVPADRNEFTTAAALMDQTRDVVGLYPQAMVADRGFHITSVFTELHDRQIAYVGPWREGGQQHDRRRAAAATGDRVDRHGVIRCQHCGGPTIKHGRHLGLTSSRGRTAIRVRCDHQPLEACAGTQTIQPGIEPRLIGALDRTDPVYWQLRHAHSNRERAHAERRARYTVGGRDVLTRTKRLGIAPQRVRLRFAQLLDWIRLCLRYGWITVKTPRGQAIKRHLITRIDTRGAHRVHNVIRARLSDSLDIPTLANAQLDALHVARGAP